MHEKSCLSKSKVAMVGVEMIRKMSLLLFMSLAIAFVVACDRSDRDGDTAASQVVSSLGIAHYEVSTTHLENFIYQSKTIPLPTTDSPVQAMTTRNDRVYFVYSTVYQDATAISLVSVNADGDDIEHLGSFQISGLGVAAFEILDNGNFALFTIYIEPSAMVDVLTISGYFYEFTPGGSEVYRRDFEGITEFRFGTVGFGIDVVISSDGAIALSVWNGSYNELLLLCLDAGVTAELSYNAHQFGNTLASTCDGRVFALDNYDGNAVLREVDFDLGSFGNIYTIHGSNVSELRLHSAGTYAEFDLFITDGTNLFGYHFQSTTQETVLNLMQAGVTGQVSFNTHIRTLHGGHIAVMSGSIGTQNFEPNLQILTPVPRAEVPERTVITLSGLTLGPDILGVVAEFNAQSQTHQIEVYTFFDGMVIMGDQASMERLEQAVTRFNTTIMAGNIPDIIVMPSQAMIDRGFMFDLAPFIEADPDINRSDFVTAAFDSLIMQDGTIPLISEGFSLHTMIGREETFNEIDAWTSSELLWLTEQMQDLSAPFGYSVVREDFISLMLRSPDMRFIDRVNFEVNFETQEFIDLLHTAKLLPSRAELEPNSFDWVVDTINRINIGNNILVSVHFFNLVFFQFYDDFIDDLVFPGLPGPGGGTHHIEAGHIGIGATSENAEYAWEFIRRFLLPTASVPITSIPMRADLFEDRLAEAMTPNTVEDEDGELHQLPRETFPSLMNMQQSLSVYAMTEETANRLRELIDLAVPMGREVDQALMDIIESDLADFFAGARSAEETARIIQSRATIWISEQELLFR